MDNPAITYDELKAALEKDACGRETEPALFALLDKLNPTPPLFGRWATHPEYGRGIIISDKPDFGGEVKFAYHWNPEDEDPTTCHYVNLEGLSLDPLTLTTPEDFENAPDGTIVEATMEPHDVYVKAGSCWWVAGDTEEANPTTLPPCRVIRWGNDQ